MRKRVKQMLRYSDFRRFAFEDLGVELAEAAITLPILLIMFAATAEFGRYYYEYTTLAKACRVGARYLATAAVDGSADASAANLVVYGNLAGTGTPLVSGLTSGNVRITRAGGLPVLPQTVKVQILSYQHQPLLDVGKLLNNAGLSLQIDVRPSVTMRYLLSQPPV